MNKTEIHLALWYIFEKHRPQEIVPASALRERLTLQVCEKSIWRSEIGNLPDITRQFAKGQRGLRRGDWVRNAVCLLRWDDNLEMVYLGGKSLFDVKIFETDGEFSENAERDFLAAIAPCLLQHWSEAIKLSGSEVAAVCAWHRTMPPFIKNSEMLDWFKRHT